jgi:tRNA 2-thiouridine synthesizing protein D
MQEFALFVTKSPYDSRNSESAYSFCLAALAAGHNIRHVFFYQSAVQNASKLLEASSDEVSMKERWQTLHKQYDVPLYVCVTASARRGVVSKHEATKERPANASEDFELVGMSEYFAALRESSSDARENSANLKSIQF